MTATATPARGVVLPVEALEPSPPRPYLDPTTGARMTSIHRVVSETRPNHGVAGWIADAALNWTLAHRDLAIELSAKDFEKLARIEARNAPNRPRDVGSYARDLVFAVARSFMAGDDGEVPELPAMPPHLVGTWMGDVEVEAFAEKVLSEFLAFIAEQRPVFKAVELPVFRRGIGRGIAGTVDLIAYLPDMGKTLLIKVTTGMRLEGKNVEMAAQRRAPFTVAADGQVVRAPEAQACAIWHMPPGFSGGYRLLETPAAVEESGWRQFLEDHRNFLSHQRDKGRPGRLVRPVDVDGQPRDVLLEHLYDQDEWSKFMAKLEAADCKSVADVARKLREGTKIDGVGRKLSPILRDLVDEYSPESMAA